MARITRICSALGLCCALFGAAPLAARDDRTSYIRARIAAADGDTARAAAGYAAALAATSDPAVALRAYRTGLQAGNLALVRRALTVLESAGKAPADASVFRLADALARRDNRAIAMAEAAMASGPFDFMLPIVRAWRDRDGADAALTAAASGNSLSRRYAIAARSLMLIDTGRIADGVGTVRTVTDSATLRWSAARLLTGQGEKDPAIGVAGIDPGKGAKATANFGVAALLSQLAEDLGSERAGTVPTVLARAALFLDPGDDRIRLVLAEALARDGAQDAALTVLDEISAHAPLALLARATRVSVIAASGNDAAALAVAREQASRRDADHESFTRYGDHLFAAERFAEAVEAYDHARVSEGFAPTVLDDLRLGGALDRAGNWDRAQVHLGRALERAPNDPLVLNAVGYARIEHDDDVAAALKLLEKAHALKPDDAAILDSVGWAYVLTGDPAKGLPFLERAIAQAGAADPVISEHLGDAYWALGRRIDARYAWQAALAALTGGDPKMRAGLDARLAGNPPPRR